MGKALTNLFHLGHRMIAYTTSKIETMKYILTAYMLFMFLPSCIIYGDEPKADSADEESEDIAIDSSNYCVSLSEAGSSEYISEGAAAPSGKLEIQLISDYSDQLRDLSVISGAYYTLRNVDIIGGSLPGNSSLDGKIEVTL